MVNLVASGGPPPATIAAPPDTARPRPPRGPAALCNPACAGYRNNEVTRCSGLQLPAAGPPLDETVPNPLSRRKPGPIHPPLVPLRSGPWLSPGKRSFCLWPPASPFVDCKHLPVTLKSGILDLWPACRLGLPPPAPGACGEPNCED